MEGRAPACELREGRDVAVAVGREQRDLLLFGPEQALGMKSARRSRVLRTRASVRTTNATRSKHGGERRSVQAVDARVARQVFVEVPRGNAVADFESLDSEPAGRSMLPVTSASRTNAKSLACACKHDWMMVITCTTSELR